MAFVVKIPLIPRAASKQRALMDGYRRALYVCQSGPEIYRVGELEVRVYKDRETMVPDLPDLPKLIDGLRVGSKQIKLYGYHDRPNKRIYTVDDIQTLIHEFRHYLEPEWEHPSPLTADAFVGESRDNAVSTMKGSSVSGKPEAVLLPKLSCLPTCLR